MLNKIKNLLWKTFGFLKTDHVILKVGDNAPWLYFSYIAQVYRHLNDAQYMNSHQNKKETVKMVEVFNSLGFNIYLQDYTSPRRLPKIQPDVVIGLEPNFNKACQKWPNAKKVYFATGAYYEHANKQIVSMTDYVNETRGGQIRYKRMTKPHSASQVADYILQIGSSYTVQTYPPELQYKVTTIDQSSQGLCLEKSYAPQNEFFFMGSGGNILKGVSLLLEYFSVHQDLVLNWIGPIEEDFFKCMKSLVTPNIHTYGFVNVNSDLMKSIVARCNFMIYPSGTEGCPGAVINCMKMGLIPIVTPWAAFDGIEPVGFVMDDWSVESIEDGVNWALSLSRDEIVDLSNRCSELASFRFNLPRFGEQLEDFMRNKLKIKG